MKRLLIISPHFPPVNAADMHRVRQSISYYKENGWEAEVVTVEEQFIEFHQDELLCKTLPADVVVHKVKAFSKKYTGKVGLGSIAYRSMYFYWKAVNKLLREKPFDLILFSTTAFPICVLGRCWKSKFKIPYIIDMQDPWRSDHYLDLPKEKRPPKFWLSYQLDSTLEKYTMRKVDGLMSVSEKYINVLKARYPHIKSIPASVIPFAAYSKDIEIAKELNLTNRFFKENGNEYSIVYIGRGGHDMAFANRIFLEAIAKGKSMYEEFSSIKIYYIGTNYSTSENADKTIEPIAIELGIQDQFYEQANRIPYFESLNVLSKADFLFVPGSDNIGYTASKIYSYVWFNKPILTLFHSSSSVNKFMRDCNVGLSLQFDTKSRTELITEIIEYLISCIQKKNTIEINWEQFEQYTSSSQVKKQIELFNNVIHERTLKNT